MTADTEQRRRPRRRFQKRRKVCTYCADSDKTINYKDVAMLRTFLTDRGRIKPRRKTGACARHQRQIAREIKRARHLALLPFTAEPHRG